MKQKMRILITGCGGAAGISVIKSLHRIYDIIAADMDPFSAGLFMVNKKVILPPGDSKNFINFLLQVIINYNIDLLIPTVDEELVSISRDIHRFHCKVMLSSYNVIDICNDKWKTFLFLKEKEIPTAESWLESNNVSFPVILKPRIGRGSKDIYLIHNEDELKNRFNETYIIQEYLPGNEYTVDVLMEKNGKNVIASIPRERLRTESGISVVGKTVKNEAAISIAEKAAIALGVSGPANIQVKLDKSGNAKILEINPRFAGTTPLSVAAGVNLPDLSVRNYCGEDIPKQEFKDGIYMIRYHEEIFISENDMQKLGSLV